MSVYKRIYHARIAPCSEDWREAIRRGIEVVDQGELRRESVAPGAFLPNSEPAPVLLRHEHEKGPVGYVTARTVHNGWHIAAFTLDASRSLSAVACDLLKRGTKVSPGFEALRWDPLLAEDGIYRYTVARFDELSILRPGDIPGYPGAEVVDVLEPAPEPTRRTRATEHPWPVGVVIEHEPHRVRRRYDTEIRVPAPYSDWPVDEVVTHIGGGLVQTADGRVIGAR